MALSHECPECRGTMEQGFMMDFTPIGYSALKWVEGPPTKSFWNGLDLKGRNLVEVVSWRCIRCGLIKHYAQTTQG